MMPDGLSPEVIKIITSTIDLREITVDQIMVPLEQIFKLNHNEVLDDELLKRIAKRNYSRVPIFDDFDNCVGILNVKKLVDYEEIAGRTIKNAGLRLTQPVFISQQANLLEILSIMEQKKLSVLMVVKGSNGVKKLGRLNSRSRTEMIVEESKARVIGMVVIKDVFERIVERDFEDQDFHFRSIMSLTFGVPPQNNDRVDEEDTKLIEMTDQTEHRHLNQPLIAKN